MLSRDYLIAAIAREAVICRQLVRHLSSDDYDFRFSESQRSTLELMRYLTYCASAPVVCYLEEDTDWKEWFVREEEAATMQPKDFLPALDAQAAEFERLLAPISEEELRSRIVELPGVGMMPLGTAIVETSYIWTIAYRHELFLRVKACGGGVNQVDNWVIRESL